MRRFRRILFCVLLMVMNAVLLRAAPPLRQDFFRPIEQHELAEGKMTSIPVSIGELGKFCEPEEWLKTQLGDFALHRQQTLRPGDACLVIGEQDRLRFATLERSLIAAWSVRISVLLVSLGFDRCFYPEPDFREAASRFALAWLSASLTDYRFERAEREDPHDCFAYEFVHAARPNLRAMVVWSPGAETHVARIYTDPFTIVRSEQMPISSAPGDVANVRQEIEGYVAVEVGSAPVIIWLEQ